MAFPRVYADFQNLDDDNRLKLTAAGTWQDLSQQGIQPEDGMVLTLYSDDADDEGQPDELRVEGTVRYNRQEQCWVAEIDWSAIRHASDETGQNVKWSAIGEPPSQPESALTRRSS